MRSTSVRTVLSHTAFEIGVALKGVHGLLEIAGAAIVYSASGVSFATILGSATYGELAEDPNDYLANILMQNASHITLPEMHFAALYLFISGVVNLILVSGLLTHRKYMFPIAKLLLGAFIVYQLRLFALTHSPWLLLLSAYDALIIWLIYKEYRRRWPSVASPTPET